MNIFTRSPQVPALTESDLQKILTGQENCNLELIPTKKSDRPIKKVQSLLAVIDKLLQKAIAPPLTEEPELKLWQKKDCYGHLHWYACDPSTGKSVSFASELEMLSWIEHLNDLSRW
jgi:hypothetical protein